MVYFHSYTGLPPRDAAGVSSNNTYAAYLHLGLMCLR